MSHMRIALIVPPTFSTHNLPAGIGTVAAMLRRMNHEVKVFDLSIRCWQFLEKRYGHEWRLGHPLFWDDQSRASVWEKTETDPSPLPDEVAGWLREQVGQILKESFDIIGFSLFTSNRKAAHYIAGLCRRESPSPRLLFGGPSVSEMVAGEGMVDLTEIGAWLGPRDAALPGEAEASLVSLIRWWETADDSAERPRGIVSYQHGALSYVAATKQGDFTSTPTIDIDDFDLGAYARPSIPIEISRGCVGRCAFCTERNLYRGYRTRQVDVVLEALTEGTRRGFCEFNFIGSAINGDLEYFSTLVSAIADRRMRIGWGGSIRMDPRMDAALIRIMAQAGCRYVNFGLESAAPAVLRRIRKPTDLSFVQHFLRLAFDEQIKVAMNLIAGFPGETEDDHRLTLAFLRRNARFLLRVHVGPCQIYEGSQLHREPERFGILDVQEASLPDQWVTSSRDNTLAIRKRRVAEIIAALNELHVPWLAPFEEQPRSGVGGNLVQRIVRLRQRHRSTESLERQSAGAITEVPD